jgi:T5SS/PEP-CTERM-associated repeat protein
MRTAPFRRALCTTSLAALGWLAAITPSRAANDFWTGSSATDWFTATNWSTGAVPTSADTALINTDTPHAAVVGAAGAQAGVLYVGYISTGTLTIQTGGTVSSANGVVGYNSGLASTVTVTGTGSSWTNTVDLAVGVAGAGALSIQNGGAVSNGLGAIGFLSGSTGSVTVTGTGSSWTNSGDLYVGNFGTGTLTIQNGGTVSNGFGYIGYLSGSTGTVTVNGAGSSWTNSVNLYVGNSGTGTLTIQNGGAVSNGLGAIGFLSGSTGTVTVTGTGSSWTNSGALFVGDSGTGTLTIQNGGTVSNGNGLIGANSGSTGTVTVNGAGSAWTNSGALFVGDAGTGTLTIQNGGTVSATNVLIANQTGSIGTLNIGAALGQAAVAQGTLNAPSVAFGAGSGQIVFNHTASNYTFAPTISGAGSVLVEAGRTILTANNTYTGATTVDGGTLSVNGSIASSSLTTINAGGTLGGNGIVGNTLINGGTLSPGNSIGLVTVQGSLTFTAASSYMVEVSPANADRTNVTGTATLGGATVNASFAAGTYVAKQYTILNATGGVGGTFGSEVNSNLPANFRTSLSYDANNAYLNLLLSFIPPPNSGLSGNQQGVANAIVGFFNANGGIPLVFGGLTPAGLTQASGELATGSQQTTFDAMNLFMGLLTDPFIAGRGDGVSSSSGAPQFAEETDGASAYAANGKPRSKSERDAYAAIYRKAPVMAEPFAQRWSVWAAGYGGSQTTDGNAAQGSNSSTSRIFGVAAGADYFFSPNTVAGFALAGGATQFSVVNNGSGRSDLFQAGAFVRHTVGQAYLTAALAYGWQDVTTDRTVTIAGIDRLRAQFNANALSGRAEGGYRFVTPWMGGLGITPYAAGQFTTFELPNYAEQVVSGANTFALAYGAKSVTAPRSEIGVRTDKSWAVQNASLTLRGRVAWAYDYNTNPSIGATFQALPGASFIVNGAAQSHNKALTTGSAEVKWINGWSAAATFEGEFSDVSRSYAGKGVVRYQW